MSAVTLVRSTVLALSAFALTSATALATLNHVDQWDGSGAVFSPDGRQLASYGTSTKVTDVGGGVVESETTVTERDGQKRVIKMRISNKGTGFTVVSDLGDGGGACYGEGICESYIDAGNGRAFATTIIEDGPNARRHLTIELQDGKAVRVMREKSTLVK